MPANPPTSAVDESASSSNPLAPPLRVPFYYGWVIVALTFAVNLTAAGTRSGASLLIQPLEAEFDWNRAAIASAASLNLLIFGIGAPISGWLVDRYGVRRIILGALSLIAAGLLGTIVMRELWHLVFFWGIVVGVGTSATPVLAASVANRWFSKHRGLALGILTNGNAAGQMLFLPLLMGIIVTTGWRGISVLMASVCIGLIAAIWFLMRDDPTEIGLDPDGNDAESAANRKAGLSEQRPSDTPVRDAFHSSTFWLLSGGFFVCGMTANGLIGTHLIPHVIDIGIPKVAAATTIGVMGGISFIGTIGAGWLVDRVDARKVLSLAYMLRGCSLFLLPFVNTLPGLLLFAVVYGIDWYATGPATAAIVADTFGRHAVARIFGWIFLGHQLGASFAAVIGGMIYVHFGEYQYAFLGGAVMAILASLLVLNINRPANRLAPAAA